MKRKKRLLTGFIICMALVGGISISQRVQAAEDDFIIEDKGLFKDSISNMEIQDSTTNNGDFYTENKMLKSTRATVVTLCF